MKNKASVFLKQIICVLGSLIKAKSMALKRKTNAMKARIIMFSLLRNKKFLLPALSHKIHALLDHDKRSGGSSRGSGRGDDDDNKNLLRNKKALLPALFHKIHALLGHDKRSGGSSCGSGDDDDDDYENQLSNKKVLLPALFHKIHALLGHDKRSGGSSGDDDTNKAIVVYSSMANEAPSNPCSSLAVVDDEEKYAEEEEEEDDDDKYPDLTHSLFDELEFDDGSGSVVDLVRKTRDDGADFNLEDEIDHVADVFIRRFHRQMEMQKQDSFKRYKEMLARSI